MPAMTKNKLFKYLNNFCVDSFLCSIKPHSLNFTNISFENIFDLRLYSNLRCNCFYY